MIRTLITPVSIAICILFVVACSKDDHDSATNRLPTFKVTVVERMLTTAIISWEKVGSRDSSVVSYEILLNNRIVKAGLFTTTDTLHNLSPDSLYQGRVIARTVKGDTASAPFELEKIGGYIVVADYEGVLYCVNLHTSTLIWHTANQSLYKFQGICTVEKDVVYVNTDKNGTFAIDAKTGQTIRNNDFGNPGSVGSLVSPYYKDGKVYTTAGTKLYALDATSGHVIWSFSEGNNYYGSNPLIDNNQLFIYAGLKMLAIDIQTGQKVWEFANTHPCVSPVVTNGLLIFNGADGKLRPVDQLKGSQVWQVDFGPTDITYTSPALYKDLVIVHAGNKGFYAINFKTGLMEWQFPETGGPYVSSPTVGNDLVYFTMKVGSGNRIVALDAAKGTQVWIAGLNPSATTPSPVFAKNLLYFGNDITWGYGVGRFNARTGAWLGDVTRDVYQAFAPTIVSGDSTFYVSQSSMKQ